jgi:enoyl-CoA hydratase/carnithine racemase
MSDLVLSSLDEGVLTLTFNRPDRLNAWTDAMGRRYFDLLDEAERDPDVRVIVVTGAGKGFCAGADFETLNALQDGSYDEEPDKRPNTHPTAIRKPLIAAVNGACAGLGMVHALMCDLVFTAADAKWTTAFARRGLIAEYGLAWLLPKLIGQGKSMDLLLSGRTFTGVEAGELGLVNRVVPGERLLEETLAYARELAVTARPPRWR